MSQRVQTEESVDESGVVMSVAEEPQQRLHMSWDDYVALPDDVSAEWVDGEVVVSPRARRGHGSIVARVAAALLAALPELDVISEAGLRMPDNRVRGPDVMVTTFDDTGATWVEDVPLLVVEVLSPSTRAEDTIRKGPEYAAAGIGQFWVVDPEARAIDIYTNADGTWSPLLHLDAETPLGEVAVGEHGVVPLDLATIVRPS